VIEYTNGLETIHLVGAHGAGQGSRVDLNDLLQLDG
jgi:hypothetical protein